MEISANFGKNVKIVLFFHKNDFFDEKVKNIFFSNVPFWTREVPKFKLWFRCETKFCVESDFQLVYAWLGGALCLKKAKLT